MGAKKRPNCACQPADLNHNAHAFNAQQNLTMKLFAGLKKIREFEKLQLPFLKSVFDFDIVIEIGYSEEQGQPLSLKQLFLMEISSRTTIRRRLATLIEQGIVVRRKDASDHRASLLMIAPASLKLLSKYGAAVTAISAVHFK